MFLHWNKIEQSLAKWKVSVEDILCWWSYVVENLIELIKILFVDSFNAHFSMLFAIHIPYNSPIF